MKSTRTDPPCSHAHLKATFFYDPETGHFTRLSGRLKGQRAGGNNGNGYLSIWINQRAVLAHRLAYFYVVGEWPSSEIDHADLDKGNNRFSNLRLASSRQNIANRGLRIDNTSGMKGVYRHGSYWRARIALSVGGKLRRFELGLFATPELAGAAYQAKAIEFHGPFARAK